MDKENTSNIETFWTTCQQELQKYTDKFNNDLGVVGFHVEYLIVDKNPIGLGYGLKMSYKEISLNHADVLVPSMHIQAEIINNIKYLLRNIQE